MKAKRADKRTQTGMSVPPTLAWLVPCFLLSLSILCGMAAGQDGPREAERSPRPTLRITKPALVLLCQNRVIVMQVEGKEIARWSDGVMRDVVSDLTGVKVDQIQPYTPGSVLDCKNFTVRGVDGLVAGDFRFVNVVGKGIETLDSAHSTAWFQQLPKGFNGSLTFDHCTFDLTTRNTVSGAINDSYGWEHENGSFASCTFLSTGISWHPTFGLNAGCVMGRIQVGTGCVTGGVNLAKKPGWAGVTPVVSTLVENAPAAPATAPVETEPSLPVLRRRIAELEAQVVDLKSRLAAIGKLAGGK